MTSRLAAVATAGAVLALPMAALAQITPKANGGGYVSKAKSSSHPSYVGFSVVKRGTKYRLVHFGIQCTVSPSNLGGYILNSGPTISSAGTFSYTGKVGVYKNDMPTPVGSATLKLSGRFTSSTKATGTAIVTGAKPTLQDCPGESFTATYQ